MSRTKYDDKCKGCEPAVLDANTKQQLPDDSPTMQAVRAVWAGATREEREAFHNTCCNNDTSPATLDAVAPLINRMHHAIETAGVDNLVGVATAPETVH